MRRKEADEGIVKRQKEYEQAIVAVGWTEQRQQSKTARQNPVAESLVALWEELTMLKQRGGDGNAHASCKMGLVMD